MQCNTSKICADASKQRDKASEVEMKSTLTMFNRKVRYSSGILLKCSSLEEQKDEISCETFSAGAFRYLSDKFLSHTALPHSTHDCINHSLHCQQRWIPFSVFCRSIHHDNTFPSATVQAIFHTMLHIMPSRTTMAQGRLSALRYCCTAATRAMMDSLPQSMIHAYPT